LAKLAFLIKAVCMIAFFLFVPMSASYFSYLSQNFSSYRIDFFHTHSIRYLCFIVAKQRRFNAASFVYLLSCY